MKVIELLEDMISKDENDKEFLQYARRSIEGCNDDNRSQFLVKLYVSTLFSNIINKYGNLANKENNLVNHFDDDRKYRGYVAGVLKIFNGNINYDDIHSIKPNTLEKLIKIKQNDVDKITELEKENKELNTKLNIGRDNYTHMSYCREKEENLAIERLKEISELQFKVKELKEQNHKYLEDLVNFTNNKQNKIEKLLENITSNCDAKKDKIKVYIKEENMLSINERNIKDSIEMWDNFNNEECCKWFNKKYPEGIITQSETYDYPDRKGVYLECFYNQPIKLWFKM